MEGFNIIVPDRPLITVHKGWLGGRHNAPSLYHDIKTRSNPARLPSGEKPKVKPQEVPHMAKHFEFINAVEPGRSKDHEVRKLVRAHVRLDSVRKARERTKLLGHSVWNRTLVSDGNENESTLEMNRLATISDNLRKYAHSCSLALLRNFGKPTALFTFNWPIEMQPNSHSLLSNYISHAPKRLYPLEKCLKSNPLRSTRWFQIALMDDAMLHGILYASALCLALLEGKQETRDTLYHFSKVAEIVNNRLSESTNVDDTTIGAMTCLALGEALVGKLTLWQTHMLGIRQMISQRGSKKAIPPMIQAKIRRADVTGAIDYASTPLMTFTRSSTPPTWHLLPPPLRSSLATQTTTLLTQYGIHPNLLPASINLALFSQTIHLAFSTQRALDPHTFSEDLYFLEYELLVFPSLLETGEEETYLDKAFRLACLLYLKAILQEYPQSSTGPSIILTQLQNSLSHITIGGVSDPLLLWLARVGGSFSSGLWEFRRWFVSYLAEFKVVLALKGYGVEEVEEVDVCGLLGLLGLRTVFGKEFERLLEELGEMEGLGELTTEEGLGNDRF